MTEQSVAPRKTLEERFWEKVEIIPWSGCWIWMGSCSNTGYGQFFLDRKLRLAHRVSFEIYKREIPKELVIDHLCRVPCCVNPNHLEAVTQSENNKRGRWLEVHLARVALITHCPKDHPYSGSNLYVRKNGSRSCRTCHREYEQKIRDAEKLTHYGL